ncbi:hypothetical protein DLM_4483 [Aquitalea magnusonii]|uniref:Uncharacterized protein n=1 Tax=Aquitalea magnusonii TaxID=332411 RepID=A0A3G9GZ48_9NEIS|nr:hypothetical protein [Aquitalea magnusonii]BBF88036.1 hypothetical protein DLM_4483 [Aquitalea magnusonii]
MEQRLIPQPVLEYLTLCLRHAVSNGQYLTPELLEEAIAAYSVDHPQESIQVLH